MPGSILSTPKTETPLIFTATHKVNASSRMLRQFAQGHTARGARGQPGLKGLYPGYCGGTTVPGSPRRPAWAPAELGREKPSGSHSLAVGRPARDTGLGVLRRDLL